MNIEKITIRGNEVPTFTSADNSSLRLQRSFEIETGPTRGVSEEHKVDITNDNMIEIVFNDGTTWFSGPDALSEIFPSASVQNRSADGGFVLPATLESSATERGIVGKVALKIVNIFLKPAVQGKVRDLAQALERKQLEHKIGLFRLDVDFTYQPFSPENTTLPYLLFLHGTGSSTKGSFEELKVTPVWNYILGEYGNRVLAFQHETLSQSPLYNAYQLIKQLPNNATLDLISHSRGGLIGEILCRYAVKDESNRGFDKAEKNFLSKVEDQDHLINSSLNPSGIPIGVGDLSNNDDVPVDSVYIDAIENELKNKKITVRKFIRVACPAAGTVLASKRLDTFLNMLLNLVGAGAGISVAPVYDAFKNLLTAVVDSKNQKNILPGLEAMNPESDFIKVLNSPATTVKVDTPLRIISGNCKAKVNLKGLLIIASKLFYLQDNDLVVNTRSMYHGTSNRLQPQFFFDNDSTVDHFHYFKNETTYKAILDALKSNGNELLPNYRYVTQSVLAGTERGALVGLEGGQLFRNTVTGTRPIVVLLPGIMGSNIKVEEDLVWIDYWDFLKGGLRKIDISRKAEATSIVATSYSRLTTFLERKYDVITFPFDWRQDLRESAKRFDGKINQLMAFNQPIKVIGHSMGGVLFRDFIIHFKDTWNKLKQVNGFRMLFLGSPLGGSYRIPAVLFGIDSTIKTLGKIDIVNTKKQLVEMFARYPGLLNLLPISRTDTLDFADVNQWTGLGSFINWARVWSNQELDRFREYRTAVHDNVAGLDYTNMVYIAGKSKDTYSGMRLEGSGNNKELVFLSTGEGDGSVTWDTGIPAKMIDNSSVYFVNVTHGALANEPSIFNGIEDILANGQTNLLSRKKPQVRGGDKVFISPIKEDFDISEQGVVATLLGLTTEEAEVVVTPSIKTWVSNGDLKYAEYPVLAGHFKYDGILYAEKEIDKNLDLALSERHKIGLYPGDIGTNEIFLSNGDGFPGAIIGGLGKFGELTAYQLTITVEQAVCNYLLTVNRNAGLINSSGKNKNYSGISALLIGSGYGGLSVDAAVRAIIQGVQNANAKVRKLKEDIQGIQELEFIELYEDTALSCFYSLSKIEKEEDNTLNISLQNKTVKKSFGRRQRLPTDTTGDWWKRISVEQLTSERKDILIHRHDSATQKEIIVKAETPIRTLQFAASTGGAREEQRTLYSSTKVIEQILEDMSVNKRWSPSLAKTIFELLVPNDFKEQLKKQGNINWILDKNTASYPWELLQDSIENARPLCVNAGMIRQLSTEDSRINIQQVTSDTALIIADPILKGFLPQLIGAYEEGVLVNERLSSEGYDVTYLPSANPPAIIEALFSKDYKIIHLAGHGLFDEENPQNSGMAIGQDVILSPLQIKQMSTTPEFVFVNCCYLGRVSGIAEEYTRSRYKLAANIGTQLIDNGVKAVVVAGWAVDDAAALDFTRKFYECMFEGSNFGDAAKEARKKVYEKYKDQNNTWGAYQCYGDPFYKVKPPVTKKRKKYSFVIPEQAEIELSNLRNKLDTGARLHADVLEDLNAIAKAVDETGIRDAAITEKEALIYAAINEYDLAIQKFEQLKPLEDALFTISTLEKYCNVRAKKYIADFKKDASKHQEYATKLREVLQSIAALFIVSRTAERYGILASTFKRYGYVLSGESKAEAYKHAAYYYKLADERNTHFNSAYAFTNRIAIESILIAAGVYNWGDEVIITDNITNEKDPRYTLLTHEEAKRIIDNMLLEKSRVVDKSDFYELVAVANLQFVALLLDPGSTPTQWQEAKNLYQKIWAKAGTKAHKITEVEHLDVLLDALTLVNNEQYQTLKESLQRLKDDLEKLI